MIPAQTLRVCPEGKPVPVLGVEPEAGFFRIMLQRLFEVAASRLRN
jgi:hypothetical protein